MSCEEQALMPTNRCLKWGCDRAFLVKRGRFWICPRCGNSYGEQPFAQKPIKTQADYHAALDEIVQLLDDNDGEYDERLALLFQLTAGWEALHSINTAPFDEPSVRLDVLAFEPTGPGETYCKATSHRVSECNSENDLEGRRLGILKINGTPHHVEAYAVRFNLKGEQVADGSPVLQEWLDQASAAAAPDGPFQTVRTRDGRSWVLFVSPFC